MRKLTIAITLAVAAVGTAFGHGVQVQITFNPTSDKIETRQIVHTDTRPNAISDLKRVYVMPLMSQTGGAGDGWYTRPDDTRNAFNVPLHPTGPGVNFQYDDTQLPGSGWAFSGSATLPNLQGSNFGYSLLDGLKAWDGAGFVDPGAEQFQVFRGDGTTVPTIMVNTSDSGPFASIALSTIASASSNAHSSMGYRMLGDGSSPGLGSPQAGDDGVYLLSLQLTSTAAGVGASDPFYYVMYKNVPQDDALAAAASLGFDESLIDVVPEPGALALLLAGAAFIVRRRR
jgi:hypothetical protein